MLMLLYVLNTVGAFTNKVNPTTDDINHFLGFSHNRFTLEYTQSHDDYNVGNLDDLEKNIPLTTGEVLLVLLFLFCTLQYMFFRLDKYFYMREESSNRDHVRIL